MGAGMTELGLIYGGTGGIGLVTARHLVARGMRVHLVGRDAEKLAACAAELGAGYTAGDVRTPELFTEVRAALGDVPLAALIYAVGTINLKPFPRLGDADFIHDFKVNAEGAALAVQAALPNLKASGKASVVLFSSVAVAQGFTSHASIAMAKGAVEGLTLALAAELAPGIRVNAIAPSLTRTPLARALTDNPTLSKAIAEMHALQRIGEPEDIAALAAFLASPESSFITGQVIGADGGRSSLRTKG
jgi:NAD(P)-dependent dehydrogenase (short-subunit alcohol dehydrogenase family)